MKKTLLITAIALGSLTANAQSHLTSAYQGTVSLSTYQGTDITKYDGLTRNVNVYRHVFNGWNTISMPFSMTEEMLNETFGSDCRLEKLAGIESEGAQIRLNFMDCKSEGIKANVPYILYYTGESTTKKIALADALLEKAPAAVTFWDINGVEVTFAAAQKQRDAKGLYGIMAKDNAEAKFVNVSDVPTEFYATRCFIQLSNGTSTLLTTNHVSAGETTSINAVLSANEKADVYNISGTKVAASLDKASISNLPAGIYVVKGKKIAVK